MPIYEFKCDDCAEVFEELVGLNDETPPQCPKCGKESRKLLSTTVNRISDSPGGHPRLPSGVTAKPSCSAPPRGGFS